MKRPISLTIIGWYLMLTGGGEFFTSFLELNSSMTQDIMRLFGQISFPHRNMFMLTISAISLVIGIGILNQKNWARFAYIITELTKNIVFLFLSPLKIGIVPSVFLFLIFAFLLFRPNVGKYYKQAEVIHAE
ncbi:MAG: hypothetical protein ABIE74_07970 [Pseudomonadota bacterium]